MPIYNGITNQKGTPAFYSDIFANRPAFGYAGRVFISTDTGAIYEDTGTAWTLIADAGAGTTGTLQQVTTNGNTTTLGIVVDGININNGAGTGTSNVAIGSGLQNNTTGSANTSLGLNSLTANTTANNNTAIGNNSLQLNTTGANNTSIGSNSLSNNTTASFNTAIGASSLNINTTGANNTALGNISLASNTTASFNTAIGATSLQLNTTGGNNTAVGYQTLTSNTTGANNTVIGYNAGSSITTGSNNTILGNYIGTSTLANNIVLADGSGNIRYQFDGTNNVFGSNIITPQVRASTSAGLSINANSGTQVADFGAGGSANITFFGGLSGTSATFTGASNPIVQVIATATYPILSLNNSGQSSQWNIEVGRTTSGNLEFYNSGTKLSITSAGNVFINATSGGNERFNVTQSGSNWATAINHTNSTQFYTDFRNSGTQTGSIIGSGGTTSYNVTSDYRLKQDLKDFNGLNIISKIKTYDYEWKLYKTRMYGVVAHELQEVIPYAVFGEKDAEEMQQVDYSKIVPILVKAIQEQQAQIEELKAKFN